MTDLSGVSNRSPARPPDADRTTAADRRPSEIRREFMNGLPVRRLPPTGRLSHFFRSIGTLGLFDGFRNFMMRFALSRRPAEGRVAEAQAERKLPPLRNSVSARLRNEVFGTREERTTREPLIRPREAEWNHDFRIAAGEGEELVGISRSAEPGSTRLDPSKPVVLFLGGSHEPVENNAYEAAETCGSQKGINFVALNYRGFGGSSAIEPSPASIVQDGMRVYRHLLEQGFPPEKIILRGYSLGAAAAARIHATAEMQGLRLGGVIYDRPMTSIKEAASGASNIPGAGMIASFGVGRLGARADLVALAEERGNEAFATPVHVIADSDPDMTFHGRAAQRFAEDFGFSIEKSPGGHRDHGVPNRGVERVMTEWTAAVRP